MRVFKPNYKFKVDTIYDIKHTSIWAFLENYYDDDEEPFSGVFSYEETVCEHEDLYDDDKWHKLTANLELGVLL